MQCIGGTECDGVHLITVNMPLLVAMVVGALLVLAAVLVILLRRAGGAR